MRGAAMRRYVTLSAVILLAACGGGGNSTGPSSPKGITLLSANPPAGATITLKPCPPATAGCQEGASLTAPVSLSFSVVTDKDYGGLFNPVGFGVNWSVGGHRCGGAHADLGELKANQPTTVSIDRMEWNYYDKCPLPATASQMEAGVGDDRNSLTNTFPGGYAFVASTPRGSQYPACGWTGSNPASDCPFGTIHPTGICKDDNYTCSTSLSTACRPEGGLVCVFCPGALCA